MSKKSEPKFMLAAAAAQASGVPQLTIRRWCRRGLIPFTLDTSGRRVFDAEGIAALKDLRTRAGRGHPLPQPE